MPAIAGAARFHRTPVLQQLETVYGEVPTHRAVKDDDGALILALVSPGGATWTIFAIPPNHPQALCVVAYGFRWTERRDPEGAVHYRGVLNTPNRPEIMVAVGRDGGWLMTGPGGRKLRGSGWEAVSLVAPSGWRV